MTRPKFSLLQSHLDLAHNYWRQLICQGDNVIDATCGNGYDSLFLAKHALTHASGSLLCLDIQQAALIKTTAYLKANLEEEIFQRITLLQQSHEIFPSFIPKESQALIVYNLGYLPGGDKQVTTSAEKTKKSLLEAKELIRPGGVISITCYPGHSEGAIEQEVLLNLVNTWQPGIWNCLHHRWLNRDRAPSLLLLQKAIYSL